MQTAFKSEGRSWGIIAARLANRTPSEVEILFRNHKGILSSDASVEAFIAAVNDSYETEGWIAFIHFFSILLISLMY